MIKKPKQRERARVAHRSTDIAPRHTIPPSNVGEAVPAEDVVAHIDVADVGQPASHQVIAHDFDLRRRVKHGARNQKHQPVGIAELKGHEPGIVIHAEAGRRQCLLRDKPGRVEGGASPACDSEQRDSDQLAFAPRKPDTLRLWDLQTEWLEDGEDDAGNGGKT